MIASAAVVGDTDESKSFQESSAIFIKKTLNNYEKARSLVDDINQHISRPFNKDYFIKKITEIRNMVASLDSWNDDSNILTEEMEKYIVEQLVVEEIIGDIKELGDGKSGAVIHLIKVICKDYAKSGHYIVKSFDTEKVTGTAANEVRTSQSIYENSPDDFRDNHLVRPQHSDTINDEHIMKKVMIFDYATDDLLGSTALCKLKNTANHSKYIEAISYDLLKKWNAVPTQSREQNDFFTSLLINRLGPDERFEEGAKKVLDYPDRPWVSTRNGTYPNPFYYIKSTSDFDWFNSKGMYKGRIHGDFHGDNIICIDTDKEMDMKYRIIDYSHFKNDGYLLYDHAYLEIDRYLHIYGKIKGWEKWENDMKKLVETSFQNKCEESITLIALAMRNSICNGIKKWATEKHLEKQVSNIEMQLALARVAAGIKFFCHANKKEDEYDEEKKKDDEEKKKNLFLYVAICLNRVFKLSHYSGHENNIGVATIKTD